MLRSVTFGVVLSVLAAACASVVEPLPPATIPAGSIPLEVEVRNTSNLVLNPQVTTLDGTAILGMAQPATVLPNTTMDVTLFVPATQEWRIVLDPQHAVIKTDFEASVPPDCAAPFISVEPDGWEYACGS